ncbi:peptide transporter family 1-like [Thrips palmi]|uniref:Oligopeptide transporter 1 n=1 Tax=Thrips palmi TaxID=161013 RepID=A0A6P9AG07_THRPL|nr:peptide transporter family 1-like [Thrips palmi]
MAERNAEELARDDQDSTPGKIRYPRAVFLIIVNEFCERFSFYALRTVLVLFLKDKLFLTEDDATIVFHAFNMTCYLFPIVGGIISDSWLGKFRTILYLSLLYAVGNVVVALASWRALGLPGLPVTCAGLLLIAMGTGGIKPCVSSFGGDQFTLPQQRRQLEQFFSVFYFIINAGGTLAILATPEVRALPCLGEDTCYPLAFGMPALLMVFFCGVFVAGKRLYVTKDLEGNILVQVSKCIASGLWRRFRRGAPREAGEAKDAHWLDAVAPRYGEALVADVKVLLRLLVLAVPLPVFWALFDMQGSRWTFQARQLDGAVGGWRLQPDQMQLSGGLLVLLLLPCFEAWLHPFLARWRVLATPLQRMSVGGLMAAAAFLCAAVLQLNVDRQADAAGSFGQVHILWQLPQYLFIALADIWFAIAVLEFGYKEVYTYSTEN